MAKTVTTISIDANVRDAAALLLKKKGITLSFYIEQLLKNLIETGNTNERRDTVNGFV